LGNLRCGASDRSGNEAVRDTDRFGAGVTRMSAGVKRIALIAAAGLLWLTGCETTSTPVPDFFGKSSQTSSQTGSLQESPLGQPADAAGTAEKAGGGEAETTGSLTRPLAEPAAPPPLQDGVPPLMGTDPNDDLNLGKQYFRQGAWGQAEQRFRRAVEKGPRDAEAWLGLAASYDRLKRFDLADRAYEQLLKIVGPTAEILNNQGFSYILRGNYRRARQILLTAQAKDPLNPYIQNNIRLLEKSARTRKAVE
jgi:tetratricopeptide (TPR) repeat protein